MAATPATQRLKNRVAVTGIGVVANVGIGADEFWRGLVEAHPASDGHISGFDLVEHAGLTKREARRVDRFSGLALAASIEAVTQSGGVGHVDPFMRGSLVGSAAGGAATVARGVLTFELEGPDAVSPHTVPMQMTNAAAAQVSMRFELKGPCEAVATACASGAHAIMRAGQLVADGRADLMIAGGSEAGLTPATYAGFTNIGAMSVRGISQPFDEERDGFVMSEGAALVVLERWDLAEARGATILAEFLGGASTADSFHITAPDPSGSAGKVATMMALAEAGLEPTDVVHVNAHGTSTPLNDRMEAALIEDVFGPDVLVTSTKGATGHSIGAAGAVEFVASILAMKHKLIPATAGTRNLDPSVGVDVIMGGSRPWTPGPTVSNSFAFGGHNAVVVLGPAQRRGQ